jgi:hypothetical protein
MDARRRVFTDVELAALVEKAAMGKRRGGEGGRRAAVLWCREDAGRWSGGAMEREARWRGKRSGEMVAEVARQSTVTESCRGATVR